VTRSAYMAAFTQDFLDAGWTVASADAAGEAWGSEESQADYANLAEHLVTDRQVDRVVFVSFSMGAIAGLHLVADEEIPNLAGWVGINPVIDLEAAHGDERFTDLIDGALSEADREDVDPARFVADDFGVPLVVFSADADSWVPGDVHGRPFASRVGAELIGCEGSHTAPDCFRADTIIAAFG